MKKLIIIGLLFLISCKTAEKATSQVNMNKPVSIQTENCPENGTCTIELLPDKTIDFKTDEFDNLYPVISEGNKTVLKYTFSKKPIENVADSNYTELIYAELPNQISELNFENTALQTIKLHYGRLCFCKGESGYFPINNGVFKLSKVDENSIKIDLNFSVKKIPQIISEIHETVSLKSNATN